MAKLYNLARMTTATTGTGTITLGAAVSGFLTFAQAGVADGDVVSYGIADGVGSEVGTGTYAAAGTTLTRTVTRSTNSNAAISLSGSAQVFITPRKEDLLSISESQSANTVLAAPNGSAGAPGFRALGAKDTPAAMFLLNTLAPSAAASVSDTTSITSAYDLYMIELRQMRPATNGASLQMQFTADGGVTWQTTGYVGGIFGVIPAASPTTLKGEASPSSAWLLSGTGATGSLDGIDNAGNQGVHGVIYLYGPNASFGVHHITGQLAYAGGDGSHRMNIATIGQKNDAGVVVANGLKFFMSSGNIQDGEIRIYGIKTA